MKGSGSFGETFLVESGKELRVIKKIDILNSTPQFVQCEDRAGGRLRCEGVPKLYGHYQDQQSHFFVFEYIRGKVKMSVNVNISGVNLLTFMEQRAYVPLHESQALHIVGQIIRIIAECHKAGVSHLDIKLE